MSPAYVSVEDLTSFDFVFVRSFCRAGNFKQSRFSVISEVPNWIDLTSTELVLYELTKHALGEFLIDADGGGFIAHVSVRRT